MFSVYYGKLALNQIQQSFLDNLFDKLPAYEISAGLSWISDFLLERSLTDAF